MNWQGDAEFRGEDFTATVTLGNPDVLVGSGRSPFVFSLFTFLTLQRKLKPKQIFDQNFDVFLTSCCHSPVRYRRNTLPPVHNAVSSSGRGAGLPPQAGRGRHSDVFSWQVHR